jgi:hypothetical protein
VPLVAQQICWRGDSTFIQVSKLAVEVDLQTVRWSRSKHAQFVDLLLQNAFLLAERANDLDVLARRIALQRRGLVSSRDRLFRISAACGAVPEWVGRGCGDPSATPGCYPMVSPAVAATMRRPGPPVLDRADQRQPPPDRSVGTAPSTAQRRRCLRAGRDARRRQRRDQPDLPVGDRAPAG